MGWISCISVLFVMFFSQLFCVIYVVLCFCLMFSPRLFKLLHLQSNKHIQKQTIQNFEKNNIKQQKYIISQPEPERYLFAVGSRAGYTVFLLFFYVFLEAFPFYLCFCFCCFCFSLVYLSVCLNTTQYTTLNTNRHEMGLFMTCVKCPK